MIKFITDIATDYQGNIEWLGVLMLLLGALVVILFAWMIYEFALTKSVLVSKVETKEFKVKKLDYEPSRSRPVVISTGKTTTVTTVTDPEEYWVFLKSEDGENVKLDNEDLFNEIEGGDKVLLEKWSTEKQLRVLDIKLYDEEPSWCKAKVSNKTFSI